MISIQNLSMHFTGEDLFTDISFLIREKDRIGLVGKNGAGKTTLLKVICGLEQPSKGDVIIPQGVTIGYLPQEKNVNSTKTVLDEALSAFDEYHQLEHDAERLQQELAERTDYESAQYEKLIVKLNNLNDRLALLGGNSIEGEAEKILVGLGFSHEDMLRPMREFSNGWQMRVELAKILLKKPNLLLLDEPTNHLDIESIQWLEGFLKAYYGAILMVSHDRAFLDNITIRTVEISNGKIYDYKVPYSDYVSLREERVDMQRSAYENQQREIKNIEAFIERFRYKATKAKQVQSRVKMLERMETIKVDEVSTESIHFQFPPAPHSGKIVIETKHLGKAYGDNQVFDGVDFTLTSGRKVAFVGRNGEGKSTMAKIIVGDINDYTGTFRLGAGVALGYYAQNQAAMLNLDKTVFETIDDIAQGDIRPKIRNILGSFLFSDDDIDKKVKVLSGGEKARLALAKLLLTPSNLLILDEPTNHLDMNSKDILKNALLQYTGTLIVVSHDRDFLNGLTDELYEFRDGAVHEFKGDIMEFLESQNNQNNPITPNTPSIQKTASSGKVAYEQSKERERERRKLQNVVKQKEQEIEALENEIASRDEVLATGAAQSADFYKEYQSLKDALDRKMQEWEDAVIAAEE